MGAGVGTGKGDTGAGVVLPLLLSRLLVGTHCQYQGRLWP
jgi:hypothetical protein